MWGIFGFKLSGKLGPNQNHSFSQRYQVSLKHFGCSFLRSDWAIKPLVPWVLKALHCLSGSPGRQRGGWRRVWCVGAGPKGPKIGKKRAASCKPPSRHKVTTNMWTHERGVAADCPKDVARYERQVQQQFSEDKEGWAAQTSLNHGCQLS